MISGDLLQHWAKPDEHFNLAAKLFMRFAGFIKPHNLGPAWLKIYKPDAGQMRGVLDWSFDHVIPAHGEPVLGGAREKFRPAIEAYATAAS